MPLGDAGKAPLGEAAGGRIAAHRVGGAPRAGSASHGAPGRWPGGGSAIDPATVFLVCNTGVIPFWVLLAAAPGWVWTGRLVHSLAVPAALGTVYAAALLLADAPDGAGFGSLDGVMRFFDAPWAALAGWVHYLVFDLFVGAWEVRDARRLGIPHAAVLPCLLFTLMLGPIGLGLYLALRLALRRRAGLAETPETTR